MASKKTGRKRSELTTRQRGFLAGKAQGLSDRKAALGAGYAESTADNAGQKIYGKESVQLKFAEIIEAAGISDQVLVRRLAEGLNARATKFCIFEGRVTSTRHLVDYTERRHYLELVLRLKGHLHNRLEVQAGSSLEEILAASYSLEEIS